MNRVNSFTRISFRFVSFLTVCRVLVALEVGVRSGGSRKACNIRYIYEVRRVKQAKIAIVSLSAFRHRAKSRARRGQMEGTLASYATVTICAGAHAVSRPALHCTFEGHACKRMSHMRVLAYDETRDGT